MNARRKGPAAPTFTSLVERQLREADDFMTVAQLRAAIPELSSDRATASLSHLRKFGAADFMASEGTTYWFATPAFDRRQRTIDVKVREEPGTRKPRRAPARTRPSIQTDQHGGIQ